MFAPVVKVKWSLNLETNSFFFSRRPAAVKGPKPIPFNVTMHAPRKLIEARRYSNIEYYGSDQLVLINN